MKKNPQNMKSVGAVSRRPARTSKLKGEKQKKKSGRKGDNSLLTVSTHTFLSTPFII